MLVKIAPSSARNTAVLEEESLHTGLKAMAYFAHGHGDHPIEFHVAYISLFIHVASQCYLALTLLQSTWKDNHVEPAAIDPTDRCTFRTRSFVIQMRQGRGFPLASRMYVC
uniref:Transmembrane protein n=1 Tax=Panagrellus redivivus TaxID=6233 RepID=A0A7E4VZW3_PANRE